VLLVVILGKYQILHQLMIVDSQLNVLIGVILDIDEMDLSVKLLYVLLMNTLKKHLQILTDDETVIIVVFDIGQILLIQIQRVSQYLVRLFVLEVFIMHKLVDVKTL
jgi:hypothetical protein